MDYFPANSAQNYGDAFEGAKTAAFRRCAKEFGVGLQAWRKDWCAGWWIRKRKGLLTSSDDSPKFNAAAPPARPNMTTATLCLDSKQNAPQSQPASKPSPGATSAQKTRWLELLREQGLEKKAKQYYFEIGQLTAEDPLESLGLHATPALQQFADWTLEEIRKIPDAEAHTSSGACLSSSPQVSASATEAWRSFLVPFGRHAGIRLEKLPKNVLFGFWANFEVTHEYNDKPRKKETIERDEAFRQALNEAGKHYEFTLPDEDIEENPIS
jgi:hypothetical protein